MLVCFDKRGVLKEQLDSYGNLPRVNSQLFKIFAYFKDLDLTNYGAAYIKLERPDINDSEYPILFMARVDLTYDPTIILPSVSNYFSANGGPNPDDTYPCYLFDFSTIVNDDANHSIVTLLDTPGEWQATITLISTVSGASNVVGTISFYVGGSTDVEEETQITFDIVTHNIATIVATKLEAGSIYYIRSMDNFEYNADSGLLPKGVFSYPGITVWDKNANALYRITELDSEHGIDDDHYAATYEMIVGFNNKLDITKGIYVAENLLRDEDPGDFEDYQLAYDKTTKSYYRHLLAGGAGWVLVDGIGILGAKNALARYVVPDNGTDLKISDIPFLYEDGLDRMVIVNFQSHDYIVECYVDDLFYITAFDVLERCFYHDHCDPDNYYMSDLILPDNRIDHVVRKYDENTLYGVDSDGNQVNFRISDVLEGYIQYDQVPNYQATFALAQGLLINIDGVVLSDYRTSSITVDSKTGYKITTSAHENLTKEQAADYLQLMTGSQYVPEHDGNKPSNVYIKISNGKLYRAEWDDTYGLILYDEGTIASQDYVDNNILTLSAASGTLLAFQYEYLLTKHARIYNSSTGVFYEKFLESSTVIIFKALDIDASNDQGTLTITESSYCTVTKTTKGFVFSGGDSEQTYGKGKLDADFATKQYVGQAIETIKKNSFIVVDTNDYPTLQDFLDDYPNPQEGYIYLYPVGVAPQETTDKGYYQYIWEDIDLGDNVDEAGWFCIGTTQIDLSNFEVSFEQSTFNNGAVSVTFANNKDFKLVSVVDTVSVAMTIPSGVSQGWISSCTFTVGNSVPTFSLTNNSSYSVVFIVNNRKTDVSGIALNLDVNGIVECMAECNGFDIRIYMKEVTN